MQVLAASMTIAAIIYNVFQFNCISFHNISLEKTVSVVSVQNILLHMCSAITLTCFNKHLIFEELLPLQESNSSYITQAVYRFLCAFSLQYFTTY